MRGLGEAFSIRFGFVSDGCFVSYGYLLRCVCFCLGSFFRRLVLFIFFGGFSRV